MAKLINAAGTMSGKLGNWVFSRNRWGPYIRTLAIPVNPMTEYQTDQRARVSYVASQWQEIPGAQRLAWDAFAGQIVRSDVQGTALVYNGYTAFMLVNVERFVVGLGLISVPPELWSGDTPDFVDFTVSDAEFSVDDLFIGGGSVPNTGQNHLVAESAYWQSRGAMFCRSWRLFAVTPTMAPLPIDLSAQYAARFGPILPADNRRYHLRVRLTCFADPPVVPSKAYISAGVTSTVISTVA